MTALIIPPQLVVGFQKREDAMDGNLSFITYKNPDDSLFNKGRFEKWISKECAIKEFSNTPQTGFVLGDMVRHGNRFSEDIIKVRIYSTTYDTEFEIDVADFLALATYTNIQAKYIEGDCVLAWENNKVRLISVKDPIYKDSKEHSDTLYNNLATTKTSFDCGDVFVVKSHKKKSLIKKQLIYIGYMDINNLLLQNGIKQSNLIESGINNEGFTTFKPQDNFVKKHVFIQPSYLMSKTGKGSESNYYDFFTSDFLFFDEINPQEIVFFGSKEEFPDLTIKSISYITPKTRSGERFNKISFPYSEINEKFSQTKAQNTLEEYTSSCLHRLKTKPLKEALRKIDGNTWKFLLSDYTLVRIEDCLIHGTYLTELKVSVCVVENGKRKFKEVPKSFIDNKYFLSPDWLYESATANTIS